MLQSLPRFSAILCHAASNPMAVDDFLRLRKDLFIDELGWPLQHRSGRESDEFDNADTVYAILYAAGICVGGWRAIDCHRPYLAAVVFDALATCQSFPTTARHIEISRLCVHRSARTTERVTAACYGLMLLYALNRQALGLVAVTDLLHERLLKRLGIVTHRYGPPRIVDTDRGGRPIRAVAGEIPIDRQNWSALQCLVGQTDGMEITDETLLLGSRRLSA